MNPSVLFVGNIPWGLTESDLADAFAAGGPVIGARIVRDHRNGLSRGFGFVEMADAEGAAKALAGLDGTTLQGRVLKVGWARYAQARQRAGL